MRTTITITAVALLFSTTACVSKSEYDRQVQQSAALSAEKDSLLSEVVTTSQFIAEVNGEIDKVRTGQPVASRDNEMETLSPTEARAQLLTRVSELTARVKDAEERMAQSRRRVAALTAGDRAASAKFDSTVVAFQQIVDNQKAEILALVDQVTALTAQNTQLREANQQLASETATLAADKDALMAENNTVYWVAGRRDDLLRRGIIEQRGGMLGIGRTSVLARTLDADEFTAINRTSSTALELPDASKSYRIISPNDMSGLEETPSDGRFKGAVRIASPETFWRPSRFLVLVEL